MIRIAYAPVQVKAFVIRSSITYPFSQPAFPSTTIENGFVDYILWSTFRPQCLDIDQELPMEAIDGGMVMFEKLLSKDRLVQLSLPATFEQAFGHPYDNADCLMLWEENGAT